jgi:hypothetical protein
MITIFVWRWRSQMRLVQARDGLLEDVHESHQQFKELHYAFKTYVDGDDDRVPRGRYHFPRPREAGESGPLHPTHRLHLVLVEK